MSKTHPLTFVYSRSLPMEWSLISSGAILFLSPLFLFFFFFFFFHKSGIISVIKVHGIPPLDVSPSFSRFRHPSLSRIDSFVDGYRTLLHRPCGLSGYHEHGPGPLHLIIRYGHHAIGFLTAPLALLVNDRSLHLRLPLQRARPSHEHGPGPCRSLSIQGSSNHVSNSRDTVIA